MSDINEGSNFADGNFSEYIAGERRNVRQALSRNALSLDQLLAYPVA